MLDFSTTNQKTYASDIATVKFFIWPFQMTQAPKLSLMCAVLPTQVWNTGELLKLLSAVLALRMCSFFCWKKFYLYCSLQYLKFGREKPWMSNSTWECFSVRPKFGFGIGNRNQGPISVSVLEPKLEHFFSNFSHFFPLLWGI